MSAVAVQSNAILLLAKKTYGSLKKTGSRKFSFLNKF